MEVAIARQKYETTAKKYDPITGDQLEAVSVYLEGVDNGEQKLKDIFDRVRKQDGRAIEHIKELTTQQAAVLLGEWSVQA